MDKCDDLRNRGFTRPRAPKRRHRRVGPSSAKILCINKSYRLSPKLFSALATADLIYFETGLEALFGVKLKTSKASTTSLPRTKSITRRAFCADTGIWRAFDLISCSISYISMAEASDLRGVRLDAKWPRNVRVGANSPSLCPTIFSVI